jgi:hypothetical protein
MIADRPRIRNLLLQLLDEAGDAGLTDAELAERARANKNHVPTRRRDLELNGLYRKTGDRRPTDTGTTAIVHVVTEKGRQWAREGKTVPPRPQGLYDPGLFRRVTEYVAKGYDFVCSPVAGESRFMAALVNSGQNCNGCGAPTILDNACGYGDTPSGAVEEALQIVES